MTDLSIQYCERRAREESHAAAQATCSEAALSHRQLARRFAAEARKLRKAAGSDRETGRPVLSLRSA